MKRKIVKLGPSTLVVSLPAKWGQEFNLKPGDELELNQEDSRLIISTEKSLATKKETVINITDHTRKDLSALITHAYRKGFDKIIIKNLNPKLFQDIKEITKNLLLGFEISHRAKNTCIVENLAEPTPQESNVLLRRIFLMIKETQNKALTDFEANNLDMAEIDDLRNQIDKFILYYRRILSKKPEKNQALTWELLTFLMHIQHVYYYLYKFANDNKIKSDSEIIKLLQESIIYFGLYYEAYFKKDMEKIRKINQLSSEYQFGKCLKMIEQKGKTAILHSYLREIFRLIQVGTSPIISLILD